MKTRFRSLLITLAATAIGIAYASDDPKDTAQTFFTELFNGDVNKAIPLMHVPPETLKDTGVDEAVFKGKISTVATMMREEAKKAGSEISVDVGDVTYTNDDKTQAKVRVTIKGKEGKDSEESDDIPLIKTEDGWKVVFD